MKRELNQFDHAVLGAALMIDANGERATVGEVAQFLGADPARVRAVIENLRAHDLLSGRKAAIVIKWGRITTEHAARTVGITPDQVDAVSLLLDRMDAASGCGCENCDPDAYVSQVHHDLPD